MINKKEDQNVLENKESRKISPRRTSALRKQENIGNKYREASEIMSNKKPKNMSMVKYDDNE